MDQNVEFVIGEHKIVTNLSNFTNISVGFLSHANLVQSMKTNNSNVVSIKEVSYPNFQVIIEFVRTKRTTGIGFPHDDESLKKLLEDVKRIGGLTRLQNAVHTLLNAGDEMLKLLEQKRMIDEKLEQLKMQVERKKDKTEFHEPLNLTLLSKMDEKKLETAEMKKFFVSGTEFICYKTEKILKQWNGSRFVLFLNQKGDVLIDRSAKMFEKIHMFLYDEQKFCKSNYFSPDEQLGFVEEMKFYLAKRDPLQYKIEELGEENLKIKLEEDVIRKIYVTDRSNEILNQKNLLLIPVFEKVNDFVVRNDPQEQSFLFDFETNGQLFKKKISKVARLPPLFQKMEDFEKSFKDFASGLLDGLDYNNVCVAGGAVLANILDYGKLIQKEEEESFQDLLQYSKKILPDARTLVKGTKSRKKKKKKFSSEEDFLEKMENYEKEEEISYGVDEKLNKIELESNKVKRKNQNFGNSDIDLFLYDLNEDEALEKVKEIYNTISKNLEKSVKEKGSGEVSSDIFVVRTKYSVTFKFDKKRSIQIVLRIYKNPTEVISGFDVDSCCILYTGRDVLCLPRFQRAYCKRYNMVDIDRQSTTYEIRLFKYAKRGFRCWVPGFSKQFVCREGLQEIVEKEDPWKMKKNLHTTPSFANTNGLARLILLENSIRIGSNLKVLVENKHDYDSEILCIPAKFRRVNPKTMCELVEKKMGDIKFKLRKGGREKEWKIPIIYKLNDLEGVLFIKEKPNLYSVPEKIRFLIKNPGTQMKLTSSFQPIYINFFEGAYLSYAGLVQKRKSEGLFRYQWWFSDNNGMRLRPFNNHFNHKLEIAHSLKLDMVKIGKCTMDLREGTCLFKTGKGGVKLYTIHRYLDYKNQK